MGNFLIIAMYKDDHKSVLESLGIQEENVAEIFEGQAKNHVLISSVQLSDNNDSTYTDKLLNQIITIVAEELPYESHAVQSVANICDIFGITDVKYYFHKSYMDGIVDLDKLDDYIEAYSLVKEFDEEEEKQE